jgi:two-component system, NarL family, sensor histidine kinase UhpB
MSLLTRVILANAAVLTVVTLLLLFSPIEINAPVTENQAIILIAGFLISLAVSILLLRRVVAPVRRLAETMRSVDPLEPGRRITVSGDTEVDALTTAFNEMLDRLEQERRESALKALAAQEQERARVARELHDEVGQVLTSVMLELDDPQAREAVRQSLEDVRRIARELRPESLDHLGLPSALRSLGISTAANGGPHVETTIALAGLTVAPEVELVVYRVAQESLTNVARHANAHTVELQLTAVDGGLRLIVRDDGGGLALDAGEGSGITGMRERALLVGGRLTVTSAHDRGTEVRLDIPQPEGAR